MNWLLALLGMRNLCPSCGRAQRDEGMCAACARSWREHEAEAREEVADWQRNEGRGG